MGVVAPLYPFFQNVYRVRESEILVEQQLPQGVFVRDHAGRVINRCFLSNPGTRVPAADLTINLI